MPHMGRKTAVQFTICMLMAFMFCLGSQLDKPVNPVIQSAAFALAVMFGIVVKMQTDEKKKDEVI